MEGYEILLLDENGAEVETNQIGEIVLKSSFFASGFWNKPHLTEAAFLPSLDGGSARMYRTGDLGRRLPDGCLIHMGRKDHQVKVRGHRIEIPEIEEVLRNLDALKETAVMPIVGQCASAADRRTSRQRNPFVLAGYPADPLLAPIRFRLLDPLLRR